MRPWRIGTSSGTRVAFCASRIPTGSGRPSEPAHSACASRGTDSRSARPSAIRVSTAFGRSSTPRCFFLPLALAIRRHSFRGAPRCSRAARGRASPDPGDIGGFGHGYGDLAVTLIPTWLRRYDRAWLPTDALAGLTIWALMVPQAMAYAGIAGVPVQNGLYVMPLAVIGYALFGSSRHLFVGPSATVATLSASSVAVVASASTGSGEYVAVTCALTLMVGVIYIAGGLARMGFVARFFARPVLEGFIVGLGLYIAIGQLPAVVGIDKPSGNTLSVLANTIADVGRWEWTTVAVGVAGLGALFALARFAPKLPGVIIVVVLAILAVKALDLQD